MKKLAITPNSDFSLSRLDRETLSCTFESSFRGRVVIAAAHARVSESDVPLAAFVGSIVESFVAMTVFGRRRRTVPIPGSSRELALAAGSGGLVIIAEIREIGADPIKLDIEIGEAELQELLDQLSAAMQLWAPSYVDEKHFIRRSWILELAMDKISDTRS